MKLKPISNLWIKYQKQRLFHDILETTGFGLLGKGFGFLVPFFIAAWYGATPQTDALFFSYGIILYLFMVFGPSLETLIVPCINETKLRDGNIGNFVGKIFSIIGLCFVVLLALALLVIKPILRVFGLFDSRMLDLVVLILTEMSPLVILLIWTSVLAGSLNAYKKFVFPQISLVFRAIFNLIIIFLLKGRYGVHAIVIGYIGGEVVRIVFLLGIISWLKLFRLHMSVRFDKPVMNFIKKLLPQTLGMVCSGLIPIVNNSMASLLGARSISLLNYAERLFVMPITFLTVGLSSPLLSHWSERFYQSGIERFKSDFRRHLKTIGLVNLLAFLILFFLRQKIVHLVYGHGDFNQESLSLIANVFGCFLLGLIPYNMGNLFGQAHLVLKNTHILMFTGFLGLLLNILWDLILARRFGISGIAGAVSLSYVFTALFQGYLFSKVKTDHIADVFIKKNPAY